MGIWDLCGSKEVAQPAAGSASASATIRKISDTLDQMEPERAKYIASFAYILGRVAHADLDISEEEIREMEKIVQTVGGLPEEQAVLVAQIAKNQNILFGSTENFVVTREFSRIATREQKLGLLSCLFGVSSSDESISTVEDNEIRAISKELRLDHSDFIAARSAYTKYLEVLKKRPPAAS